MSRLSLATLALLAAAGPSAAQAPDRVEITLSNFAFTPSTIRLRHGQPYVLHFANSAKGGHDFVAKRFFAAAMIAPQDRKATAKGRIVLDGGAAADIHLTAPGPGRYKVHCSHFMHSTFGMTGAIVVE